MLGGGGVGGGVKKTSLGRDLDEVFFAALARGFFHLVDHNSIATPRLGRMSVARLSPTMDEDEDEDEDRRAAFRRSSRTRRSVAGEGSRRIKAD